MLSNLPSHLLDLVIDNCAKESLGNLACSAKLFEDIISHNKRAQYMKTKQKFLDQIVSDIYDHFEEEQEVDEQDTLSIGINLYDDFDGLSVERLIIHKRDLLVEDEGWGFSELQNNLDLWDILKE